MRSFVARMERSETRNGPSRIASGLLLDALDEARAAFTQATGIAVETKYGPSGLLKDEIAGGANADVFGSANMDHPQALARAGKSGQVVLFARNRLCALVRPGLAVDRTTLLDRMLDPAIKLATSTPKSDPSGDYAWTFSARRMRCTRVPSRRSPARRCN